MQQTNKNQDNKRNTESEIERQKIIDEGGRETYDSKNKKKDDNVLIDSEH